MLRKCYFTDVECTSQPLHIVVNVQIHVPAVISRKQEATWATSLAGAKIANQLYVLGNVHVVD